MSTQAVEIDFRPRKAKIKVRQGNAWFIRATVSVKQGATKTPIDLTGYDITVDGINVTISDRDDVNGVFHFGQASATESGRFDITLVTSGGSSRTYVDGTVTVEADPTP